MPRINVPDEHTQEKVVPTAYMETTEPQGSVLTSIWMSLLRSASEETGLSKDTRAQIMKAIFKTLDAQFTDNFDNDLQDLLALNDHQLEDRIASETRALRRDQRRARRKQGLLADEEARLQSFRPAREDAEQDEAREIADKLHPLAKQFLSKKTGSRASLSSRALQELESSKRELESLEEGLLAYDPDQDDFLNDLLQRLKPPKIKKHRT